MGVIIAFLLGMFFQKCGGVNSISIIEKIDGQGI